MTNKGVEDSIKPGFWETQKTGKYTTFYFFSKVNKYFRLHPISFKYQLKLQNLMTIYIDPIAFFLNKVLICIHAALARYLMHHSVSAKCRI